MLNEKQKQKLKKNWGVLADTLECLAEVRVYDPLSSWESYILAMNPEDEDEIFCIIKGCNVEACQWRLTEMQAMHNSGGDHVKVDKEYKPRKASEIYKILTRNLYAT